MEFSAKIISRGRITIPDKIREELGLEEGDVVQVEGLKKMVLVEQKEAS